MNIRKSLVTGLAGLAAFGALQGAAGLLGNLGLQQQLAAQTVLLATVTDAASAQLAFERADRYAQASRGAANPMRRLAFAESFRAEAVFLKRALVSASASEPAMASVLRSTTDWIEQTDLRLPGSKSGPQVALLRDDLLSEMSNARQTEIASTVKAMLQRAELNRAEAVDVAARARSAILLIVGLSLVVSVWLALVLRRRVLRPLSDLTGTTLKLAAGELDCRIDGTSRKDEIGAVATALETLRQGTLHTLTIEAAAAKERSASDARVRYLAHHDQLTGLANRTLLHDRLDHSVALARRSGQQVVLFWIDLDCFKEVNDSRGHAAGDALLREVARRLVETVRETDTVARLGGDEFVVVQLGAEGRQAAGQLADRLVAALSELYDVGDGQHAVVTASIGVALFPDDAEDAGALLANADLAMYRVKASGRNTYAFFQEQMDQEARAQRSLDQDLRLALSRQQTAIMFQPQLDLLTGEVIGFEALLRWRHPERGQVPPDLFIPIAESNGAIVPIGAWVLQQACEEAARWTVPLRVAVNVSPAQFLQTDMAALVGEVLLTTGLDPLRLELEVTEGILIRDPVRTLEALRRIRLSGVTVALDDFGTGYSSLSTLRAFPFDRIKIDRSFVKDMASSRDASAIVHAVLGLADGLGLPVVAEGVETEEQLALLKAGGCAEVQGYLIGRPEPVAAYADFTCGSAPAGATPPSPLGQSPPGNGGPCRGTAPESAIDRRMPLPADTGEIRPPRSTSTGAEPSARPVGGLIGAGTQD